MLTAHKKIDKAKQGREPGGENVYSSAKRKCLIALFKTEGNQDPSGQIGEMRLLPRRLSLHPYCRQYIPYTVHTCRHNNITFNVMSHKCNIGPVHPGTEVIKPISAGTGLRTKYIQKSILTAEACRWASVCTDWFSTALYHLHYEYQIKGFYCPKKTLSY